MHRNHDIVTPPKHRPEPGFYYHYKHDPNGAFNNFAYFISGTGHHTEENARPEDTFMQVYLPLYEDAPVYKGGKMFDLRPLDMAMEEIKTESYEGPRFIKITDEAVIELLKEQARKMYGKEFW